MKKILALLLSALMAVSMVGCSGGSSTGTTASTGGSEKEKPLVVGYSNFNEKFSPFFSETAYDWCNYHFRY